ncbi:hypothetical protein ABT364_05755 [Massilia sp. SR12]
MSIAVSIKYARPFATGVRAKLSLADLDGLDERQRAAHDYLLAYRAKHIAHSVNGYERNQPRANYCVERVQDEGITSITCSHARVVGLNGQRFDDVIELSSIFIAHVDHCIAEESDRLLQIARSIPIDELLSAGQSAFSGHRLGDVAKSRT